MKTKKMRVIKPDYHLVFPQDIFRMPRAAAYIAGMVDGWMGNLHLNSSGYYVSGFTAKRSQEMINLWNALDKCFSKRYFQVTSQIPELLDAHKHTETEIQEAIKNKDDMKTAQKTPYESYYRQKILAIHASCEAAERVGAARILKRASYYELLLLSYFNGAKHTMHDADVDVPSNATLQGVMQQAEYQLIIRPFQIRGTEALKKYTESRFLN